MDSDTWKNIFKKLFLKQKPNITAKAWKITHYTKS